MYYFIKYISINFKQTLFSLTKISKLIVVIFKILLNANGYKRKIKNKNT